PPRGLLQRLGRGVRGHGQAVRVLLLPREAGRRRALDPRFPGARGPGAASAPGERSVRASARVPARARLPLHGRAGRSGDAGRPPRSCRAPAKPPEPARQSAGGRASSREAASGRVARTAAAYGVVKTARRVTNGVALCLGAAGIAWTLGLRPTLERRDI